jgi:hypothetical protein
VEDLVESELCGISGWDIHHLQNIPSTLSAYVLSVYALVCLCFCLFIFVFWVESDRVWMAVNVSPLTPKFSDSNFILFWLLSFSKVNRKNQQKLIWSISNLFIIKFLMAVPKLIGCHKNGLLWPRRKIVVHFLDAYRDQARALIWGSGQSVCTVTVGI